MIKKSNKAAQTNPSAALGAVKCALTKLAIVILLLLQTSCIDHQGYCDSLKVLADTEQVNTVINKWLDLNVLNG